MPPKRVMGLSAVGLVALLASGGFVSTAHAADASRTVRLR